MRCSTVQSEIPPAPYLQVAFVALFGCESTRLPLCSRLPPARIYEDEQNFAPALNRRHLTLDRSPMQWSTLAFHFGATRPVPCTRRCVAQRHRGTWQKPWTTCRKGDR